MIRQRHTIILGFDLTVALALPSATLAGGGKATDGPQDQPNPQGFATGCHGYLGPLRSAIARGLMENAELGIPAKFSGDFNPGKHYGSVGEEQFLDALGLDTSCNS
jgi:hypothetical protein